MQEIEFENYKKICIEILKEFNKICKENNLKYSLAYGTLIGAVRHKGFIPWDDDIDVVMPREDYEKLMELHYNSNKYEIKSYRYTKKYYYIFAKMIDKETVLIEENRCEKNMGAFIDIFPMDCYNLEEKNIIAKKAIKIKKVSDFIGAMPDKNKNKKIKYFFKIIVKNSIKPYRKILLKMLEAMVKSEKGKLCTNLVYSTKVYEFNYNMFDNLIDMEFDNIKAKVTGDYHNYLTTIYGDYMKFPPKEEQIPHHRFKAYLKK